MLFLLLWNDDISWSSSNNALNGQHNHDDVKVIRILYDCQCAIWCSHKLMAWSLLRRSNAGSSHFPNTCHMLFALFHDCCHFLDAQNIQDGVGHISSQFNSIKSQFTWLKPNEEIPQAFPNAVWLARLTFSFYDLWNVTREQATKEDAHVPRELRTIYFPLALSQSALEWV